MIEFDPAKEPALEFKPHRPLLYVSPTPKTFRDIYPLIHQVGCREFLR
jgi:hypothetical protein